MKIIEESGVRAFTFASSEPGAHPAQEQQTATDQLVRDVVQVAARGVEAFPAATRADGACFALNVGAQLAANVFASGLVVARRLGIEDQYRRTFEAEAARGLELLEGRQLG